MSPPSSIITQLREMGKEKFMHERTVKTELLVKKEAIRQWFEFYKIALASTNPKIKKALQQSASFYESWGNISAIKFNDWWEEKSHLFTEINQVRVLNEAEERAFLDSIVIEVSLTQSTTKILKKIKLILDKEYERRQLEHKKSKTKPTHRYALSDSSEPKLAVIREKLTVYRDVYLENTELRGQKLLDATRKFYSSRKRKKDIPFALLGEGHDGDIRAMRNLRRYIQDAQNILQNVAEGSFPGKY
jgi:hypothetical protein